MTVILIPADNEEMIVTVIEAEAYLFGEIEEVIFNLTSNVVPADPDKDCKLGMGEDMDVEYRPSFIASFNSR